jgi:F-type H+-transporting ATPase subunit epsilon
VPIHFSLVTQDRLLYDGPADIVVVPGSEGEMGILPHHAPLLSSLSYGVVRLRHAGAEQAFVIAGGILEVQPDRVTVLADVGENVEEIDLDRAAAARSRAEELLRQAPPPGTDAYLAIEAALRRSNLRLDAVRRYRRARRPPGSPEAGRP